MSKQFLLIFSVFLLFSSCRNQATFDERVRDEAVKTTLKICPKEVTQGITLDSIVYAIPTKTKTFYYSMSEEWEQPEQLKQGEPKFREALRRQIVGSIGMKREKEHGITFRHVYFSKKTGKVLLQETYTKDDYADK